MRRIAIQLLASLTAACSTPLPPTAPPPASNPVPAQQAAAPAPPPPAKAAPVAQTESPIELFERVRDAMANKSIYFDYDQYAICPDLTTTQSRRLSIIIDPIKNAESAPRRVLRGEQGSATRGRLIVLAGETGNATDPRVRACKIKPVSGDRGAGSRRHYLRRPR